MECPSEDLLLDLLEHRLSRGAVLDLHRHIDACHGCRVLLAEAARTAHEARAPGTGAGEPLPRGALVGRYTVLAPLGHGGMGVVYAAYDAELDRRIALKLLRADAGGGEGQTRLLREAQAMAKLSHPNVVSVFDVGSFGEQVVVAMEFLDGGTLRRWLEERSRPWRDVLEVFLRAGRGLAAAHAAGLVHRDFKPENVLLGSDGRVRVADFGLARFAEADSAPDPDLPASPTPRPSRPLTHAGTVMGTPAYMAPEQEHGAAVDARADQYSYCVALHEALCGERPAPGRLSKALKVPSGIRAALARGLRPSPDDRFPSMEPLLAALARDPSVRRRRLLGAALGALCAGAAIGVAALAGGEVCVGAERHFGGVWDETRRDEVRAAFLRTARPFAADTWARVEALLGALRQRWVAGHTDACEATRVRGEQSEELLDRRVLCLREQLQEISALTRVFTQADARTVERAVAAVQRLPAPEKCQDVVALRRGAAPPLAPAARAALDEVRAALAEARALRAAGRYDEAALATRTALQRARQGSLAGAEAEALLVLADVLERRGQLAAGEAAAHEALALAEAERAEEVAARAATLLAFLAGHARAKTDEGQRWGRLAAALIQRAGGAPELTGRLLRYLAEVANIAGRYDTARVYAEQARQVQEPVLGPEHPDVLSSRNALGTAFLNLDRLDEAAEQYRRVLALRERSLGKSHPEVAAPLNNLGIVLERKGQYEEARRSYAAALRIWETGAAHEHPRVASAHVNLGLVLRRLGRYAEALEHCRRATEIFSRVLGPEHAAVAAGMSCTCRVQVASGDRARALSCLEATLALKEKALGAEHPAVARTLVDLGEALLSFDAAARAVAPLSRAVAIRARRAVAPARLAEARFALARALWDGGDDRARARSLAEKARDVYAGLPASRTELARVEEWLRTRR